VLCFSSPNVPYSGVHVATLGSRRRVPLQKFDQNFFFLNQCSTFLLEYACRYVPCLNIYNVYNINVQSANYSVDNPSDYWKISLYLVFLETLDNLVDDISKRVVSIELIDCSIPNREIYQGK
jgi:hypothetical protein